MNDAYAAALAAAAEELKDLAAKKREIDSRILRVRQTVATLLRLISADDPASVVNKGIADAIREALRFGSMQEEPAATPRQLRRFLETIGYDFSKYSNPIASINGTLQQMVTRGEAEKVKVKRGEDRVFAYRWKEPEQAEKAKGED